MAVVPFSFHESRWSFASVEAASLEFFEATLGTGAIALSDPTGKVRLLRYNGAGVSAALEIRIPMKILRSRLLGMSVKPLKKPIRRAINTAAERISTLGKDKEAFGFGKGLGGQIENDDEIPERSMIEGLVLAGPLAQGRELERSDFSGGFIMLEVDLGFIGGINGKAMLFGVRMPKSGLQKLAIALMGSGMGRIFALMQVLSNSSGLLIFGGPNIDFRAGGGVTGMIGEVR